MSDYSNAEKQSTIEIKVNENEVLNQKITAKLPLDSKDKIKNDTENNTGNMDKIRNALGDNGFTNELSGVAKENLKRLDNNEEPILDTRYIKETDDLQTKLKDVKISDLQAEFSEEKYQRKKLFGGTKDSDEMLAVKDSLSLLVDYLLTPITDTTRLAENAELLSNLYKQLIVNCQAYLSIEKKGIHTTTGALRKEMVKRILDRAVLESELIVSVAKDTQKSVDAGDIDVADMKWEDILFKCRAMHYSKEQGDNIGVVGGGTSTVYVVKKEGKNFYFKNKENLKSNTIEEKRKGAFSSIDVHLSLGKIKKREADWVRNKVTTACNFYQNDIDYGVNSDHVIYHIMQSFRFFNYTFNTVKKECDGNNTQMTQDMLFKKYLETTNKEYKLKLSEKTKNESKTLSFIYSLFGEIIHNNKKLDSIVIGLGALSKEFISASVMKNTVKLPPGASITNNNVATSRMANLLNMSDVVCKSETAVLNIEGQTKIGNIMVEAEGEPMNKIKPGKQKTLYSGKAKKQLLQLAVLDYIMGQTDRHNSNFFVTTKIQGERVVITGVKALDNDCCCGIIDPEEIEHIGNGKSYAALSPLTKQGKLFLPAIDLEFANSILALSLEDLLFEMADILLPEQIEAMYERLSFVQDEIRKVLKYREDKKNDPENHKEDLVDKFGIRVIESDEEWEEFGNNQYETNRLQDFNSYMFKKGFDYSPIKKTA